MLQDRCFERVGGSEPLPMRARVVAATSRDLHREVALGRFRAALYFRVAVARVELPPLRERPEDIAPLARNALGRIGRRLELEPPRLGPALFARLAAHSWPGNVRELENVIERLAIRCPGRGVELSDLAAVLEEEPWPDSNGPAPEASAMPDLRELSAARICRALVESQGNVARAARCLGLSRTTLRRRIEGLGLRPGGSAEARERQALEHQQS